MPTEAYAELAMRLMLPGSERMARIWEMVLTDDDDAKLVLAMPGTAEALVEGGELRPILAPSRFRAVVDAGVCTEDGLCGDICPTGAIRLDDDAGAAVVNGELCLGCGLCATVCPADAVELQAVREPDFIPA